LGGVKSGESAWRAEDYRDESRPEKGTSGRLEKTICQQKTTKKTIRRGGWRERHFVSGESRTKARPCHRTPSGANKGSKKSYPPTAQLLSINLKSSKGVEGKRDRRITQRNCESHFGKNKTKKKKKRRREEPQGKGGPGAGVTDPHRELSHPRDWGE